MEFDYSKLNGKIREVFKTQGAFADKLRISRATLSFKLNNTSEFTQKEMIKALNLLKIPVSNIDEYFFCIKSSEN